MNEYKDVARMKRISEDGVGDLYNVRHVLDAFRDVRNYFEYKGEYITDEGAAIVAAILVLADEVVTELHDVGYSIEKSGIA